MTIVATEDTRNVEWRKSNVGLKLLEKMGYKDGEGIGKRNQNNTALRALKRKEGLGLGAKIQSEGGNSESANHFSTVLSNLQEHHEPTTKKSRKKRKGITLPQNKVTAGHASKMREAKFGAKSAEDMACIFGNTDFPVLTAQTDVSEKKKKRKSKKRERDEDDENQKQKRKDKKKKRKEEKKKGL
ncbi:unnamed protein product [Cylindrotheca closterium]|uniref:G-patch domain-containing protein n=1 Tax=Cylindrotheca closterium TaxID=2856 RepID=A0AAD2PVH8_9STRA|nr:unnamed protein product [Cylindrotheca closterium]